LAATGTADAGNESPAVTFAPFAYDEVRLSDDLTSWRSGNSAGPGCWRSADQRTIGPTVHLRQHKLPPAGGLVLMPSSRAYWSEYIAYSQPVERILLDL